MKRTILFFLALALLCLTAAANADTRVMVVSDTHLMAPELYGDGALLHQSLLGGDGKVSDRSQELADGLVAEVLHQQPDVFLITGDLTYTGELLSHKFMAATLQRIIDAGIPVCVIPGNHDICTWIAYDYSGEKLSAAHTTSPETYRKLYAEMMPGEAPDGDVGMSYLYKVNDLVWLLMLDTCYYDDEGQAVGGYLRDDIMPWAEQVYREAQEAGAQVITATHQSLTAHSEYRASQYSVYDGAVLEQLMARYGAKLNLSGHAHLQHILTDNGIWDAALCAYCISPHLYAMVTVADDGSMTYQASPACAEHFPEGFVEETKAFYFQVDSAKNRSFGDALGDRTEACRTLMTELNYAGYNGTLDQMLSALEGNEDWQLLAAHREELTFVDHLLVRMEETTRDMRYLAIH